MASFETYVAKKTGKMSWRVKWRDSVLRNEYGQPVAQTVTVYSDTDCSRLISLVDACGQSMPSREQLAPFKLEWILGAAGLAQRADKGAWLVVPGRFAIALWYLAGIAGLALGTTYLIKAAEIAALAGIDPPEFPPCDFDELVGPICSETLPVMRHNALTGIAVFLGFAATFYAVRLLARWAGLGGPLPRRFALLVAALFAAIGLVLFVANPATGEIFGVQQIEGLWPNIIGSGVAALVSVIALSWYAFRAFSARPAGG